MAAKKENALATLDSFALVGRYDGMDEGEKAELMEEMADLDEGSRINCRTIKIPAGGKIAYEVQGDEEGDEEYPKVIEGVILFTHRMNGYWPNSFGQSTNLEDKAPQCSSMDGINGLDRSSGEVRKCKSCPYNQWKSGGKGGNSKACKNMRRIYLMRNGDPNLYLLTVPPSSIKPVNDTILKIMASSSAGYTRTVFEFSLAKDKNPAGIEYSKVVITKKGLLPAETAKETKALRSEIKDKYAEMAVSLDEYEQEAGSSGLTCADERSLDVQVTDADFTEIKDGPESDIIPF